MTLAVGAGLLVGCAATGTDTPGGSGAVTSVPARDDVGTDPVPGNPGSTPLPVRAPSAEFVDRARLVADAVRRAGVPVPPTQLVLLSGWGVDEGFDTSEQKVAWGSGHITLAPAVDKAVAGSGTLRLADGSTRPVDLLGVRRALDRTLDGALGTPTDCNAVVAAQCRLVVSRAVLSEAKVRTAQGEVTAPVWRLTIDGLSHTISVIAVGDGVMVRPQYQGPLAGLPDAPAGLRAADSLKRVDGATVDVGIAGGGCDVDLAAHVVELGDMVVVGGTAQPPPKDVACPAIYISKPATLHLAKPLGTRPVIDVVTGRPRLLGVPAF
ncbi:hypothetical protein [Terrabacter sp. 2RAF25]|uniref:hypothetical protein n=1 Tax=Terrabacter sp. 2RAF25 TaxID=3232998 RepID=UPI003F9CD33F